ncbi:hypothetical protein IWW34DRAFT_885649 [Fusarium oxysporum f. sp. albedinis]|nr:hypothetical protein IWW34DRAFT_885649 [Fusarium oxysporum f. sp. albedinis]
MTDKERAALDPNSREHFNRVWGSKIQVIGWSFYAFILWALKLASAQMHRVGPGRLWLTLISRHRSGLTHLKTRVRAAYMLLAITYLAVAFKILLSCQPMHKFWQINPDPGTLCKPTNSPAYVLVVVIPNVLTDAYLLYIPLSLLWGVNISVRRRISLMLLFSGALFIITAGTIRAVVILTLGLEGAVSGSSWACRETFVAIVVTNLPIIQPLLRMGSRMMGLKGLFSSQTNTAGESHQLRSSEPGRSRFGTSRGRERPPRHPLSAPQATAWGSDEYILREDSDGKNSGRTDDSGGIEITQEINVRLEEVPAANPRDTTPPAANDWGFKTEVRKKPRAVRGLRLASY